MTQLAAKDQSFLHQCRQGLTASLIIGWLCIGLPLVCWVAVWAGRAQVIERLSTSARTSAVASDVAQRVAADRQSLQSLYTTTPLERQLIKQLMRKNEEMLLFYRSSVAGVRMAVLNMALLALLAWGVVLLRSAHCTYRFLRMIATVETHG